MSDPVRASGCGCCGTATAAEPTPAAGAEQGSADPTGAPDEVAGVQTRIVALGGTVGPLQAAAAVLAIPAAGGGCDEDCGCLTAAAAVTTPRIPASRMALGREAVDGSSDIECTLEGGTDAMRDRISQWQQVIAAATGREAAEGGITLLYDHDPAVTVELARLAAAEFACCLFFTFTLTVGPDGMRFTVSAPDEAADVVTAVFGTAPATLAPAGGN